MSDGEETRPGLAARWRALPGNLRGALWMLLAGLLFSVMGAIIKALGARLDAFQIGFFRCAVGLVAVLPFMLRSGRAAFPRRRLALHATRGALGTAAMFCSFYALTVLPLADATAISFAVPLFTIPFAVLLLGEVVRWRRWTATGVGFAGVLVMVGPGGGALEPAVAIAVLGALLVALVNVTVKQLSRTEPPLAIVFSFSVVATLTSAVPAAVVWRAPTASELALLMAVGALGATAQTCAIRGFAVGEATAVVPFDYVRLLYAGLIGYWIFAEVPGWTTLAGAALIVLATLYIARREAMLGRTRRGG